MKGLICAICSILALGWFVSKPDSVKAEGGLFQSNDTIACSGSLSACSCASCSQQQQQPQQLFLQAAQNSCSGSLFVPRQAASCSGSFGYQQSASCSGSASSQQRRPVRSFFSGRLFGGRLFSRCGG